MHPKFYLNSREDFKISMYPLSLRGFFLLFTHNKHLVHFANCMPCFYDDDFSSILENHFLSTLVSSDATMGRRTNYSPIPSPLHSPPLLGTLPLPPLFLDRDHMHLNLSLIILILISTTASIVIFLITLSKILRHYYYSRRSFVTRSNPPILFDIRGGDSPFSDDDEEQGIRHPGFIPSEGLQQSIIDSITVLKYKKDHQGLVKETECLVCLGEFQHQESLRLLPKCNHAFHVPCIDTWFRSHKTCPLCRAPIVHDAASSVGDEEFDYYSSEEAARDATGIHVLHECDQASGNSSILIASASDASAQEFEDEIESIKMDSSSASMDDVLDLNLDIESSDTNTNTNLVVEKKASSISSNNNVVGVAEEGSQSSNNYKVSSIEHALHERHFSLRSSSHNTKFVFSRRSRSHSSILPL